MIKKATAVVIPAKAEIQDDEVMRWIWYK